MEIICEIMQWCEGRGFKFHNCDINDDRIPCSLDKKYIPRNNSEEYCSEKTMNKLKEGFEKTYNKNLKILREGNKT